MSRAYHEITEILRSRAREEFLYGIWHIPCDSMKNKVIQALNNNEIQHIPYEYASLTGLRNHCNINIHTSNSKFPQERQCGSKTV